MDTPTIMTLAGIVLGSQWLGQLILKIYDNHIKKKVDPLDKIQKQLDDLTKALESNSELTMSHARERLNWLCNEYSKLGYIPEDQYVAFKLLGESYIKANGNHGFEIKFNHTIDTLPTK